MLVKVGPLIHEAILMDCTFAVADREKFLLHLSAKEIDLGELEGKPISSKGALYEAIHTGKYKVATIPKESYGVPYKATGLPVRNDNGAIFGALSIGINLKNQEILKDMARDFASTCEEVAASTEELAASAEELASEMEILNVLY